MLYVTFQLLHPVILLILIEFRNRTSIIFRLMQQGTGASDRLDNANLKASVPVYSALIIPFSGQELYELTGPDGHSGHWILCCHGVNARLFFDQFFQSP